MINKSSLEYIDPNRFSVAYGSGSQEEIFEAIAKYVRETGDTVDTIELSTGSWRFQATVGYYTEDISRCRAVLG
jgi:hypothetical protein